MGILEGLASAKKVAEDAAGSGGDYVKVNWLSIKDKEVVRAQFLQEIDADSPGYNEAAGTAILAVEHTPQEPFSFKRKFLCTKDDEGKCWGCDQVNETGNSKWKAKVRFYANVLVDGDVKVISQGFSDKSITPNLISYAEEVGGITGASWKIGRTGSSQNTTSYTAIAVPAEPADPTKYELFDLKTTAVRDIPYEKQEAYVRGGNDQAVEEAPAAKQDSPSDW